MALTPPPAAPQRGDRATFAQRVDAFITWLINFVSELVGLVANLNSIAAGGAYAIPYLLSGNVGAIGAGGYLTSPGNGFLYLDNIDARGANVASLLSTMVASTSGVKGVLRLTKQGDPNSWQEFSVSGPFNQTGALGFAITYVAGSGGISPGDSVLVDFSRTGDKGDAGPMPTLGTMIVRDQKAPNASAQGLTGGVWTTRELNTAVVNTIPGASLSANKIALPAGTYWIDASASCLGAGANVIRLFNVTDNSTHDIGLANRLYYGDISLPASLRTFVATGPKEFRIDHYLASGNTFGGFPSGMLAEIYAEVKIIKVG